MADEAFTWGSGGNKLTPDDRKRRLAEALVLRGTSTAPVQHWTQGLARVADALMGQWETNKLDAADKAGIAEQAGRNALLMGGMSSAGASASTAAAPSSAVAAPNVTPDIKDGIVQTAAAIGADPVDLATAISYETGGTFNPTQAGPRTKWGQHRGLIQFGEPQAKQHGVDWSNPVGSQLGPNGAVASYMKASGYKPGMNFLDLYSTINAGAPGLYNRSDAAAGGAPGTVRDKVEQQMQGHRAKAQALLRSAQADMPAEGAIPAEMAAGQPGFAVPQAAPASMTGQTFDAITSGAQPLDPVFQSEGTSQPWMGTAIPPQPPMVAQAPLPPPRPADLALANPQADMPAPGAVQAMGQMPQAMPDLSNSPDGGMRQIQLADEQARQGQLGAPQAAASPVQRIVQALSGQGQTATVAAPSVSPGVQNVSAALAPQAASATPPSSGNARVAAAFATLNSPYAKPGERAMATAIVQQSMKDPVEAEGKRLAVDLQRKQLSKSDDPTSIQEYNLAKTQGETRSFTDWKLAQTKAGATSVNVNGGGSDKQIFDTVKESSDGARSAATGLNAVREARAAVKGGAFLGAGADTKLAFQKIGASLGLANADKIVNTETFRSAIAPAVASLLKSTVGSANISNSDREFAEKAAGGSISLDEGTITRLLDIMERGNVTILEGHQKRMDAIYPDEVANKRERALFGVPMPAAPAAPPAAAAPDRAALEAEARRRGLIK